MFNVQKGMLEQRGLLPQYERKQRQLMIALKLQRRGLRINDGLRRERIDQLTERATELTQDIVLHGLAYIWENEVKYFEQKRRCFCCKGGKVVAQRCWRCAEFFAKPNVNDLRNRLTEQGIDLKDTTWKPSGKAGKYLKSDYEKALLGACRWCGGTGKIVYYGDSNRDNEWAWNPFSSSQMQALLQYVEVPKSLWGRKPSADENTLARILDWARGPKQKLEV
jgi:hypothetical protein